MKTTGILNSKKDNQAQQQSKNKTNKQTNEQDPKKTLQTQKRKKYYKEDLF